MNRPALYWRTLRYLKPRQWLFLALNRLRPRARLRSLSYRPAEPLAVHPLPDMPAGWPDGHVVTDAAGATTFTLLNQSTTFGGPIDWNCANHGKLWTYHLNYFGFLHNANVTPERGRALMQDFVGQSATLREGLEPYPTSLRIQNWIGFLSKHNVRDPRLNQHLYAQVRLLRGRLEHHLLGNHLLENGVALLLGAVYFRQRPWFGRAARLLTNELTKQVLPDGGHEERSPTYHQILLSKIFLSISAVKSAGDWHGNKPFCNFLIQTADRMLGWLLATTFRNGDVAYVNDAAEGTAPTTLWLTQQAIRLGLTPAPVRLAESGYRLLRTARLELLADVAPVGPDHQPGHAHADTLAFVLHADGRPLLTDAGTSTYQLGERRGWERSTAAHNTVAVAGQNSSEVWAGFRVGRRARVTLITDSTTLLTARHDGYRRLGLTHERSWHVANEQITVTDRLLPLRAGRPTTLPATARFYVAPGVDAPGVDAQDVVVSTVGPGAWQVGPLRLTVAGPNVVGRVVPCELAAGFNRLRPSVCLEITFSETLITTLTLPP